MLLHQQTHFIYIIILRYQYFEIVLKRGALEQLDYHGQTLSPMRRRINHYRRGRA